LQQINKIEQKCSNVSIYGGFHLENFYLHLSKGIFKDKITKCFKPNIPFFYPDTWKLIQLKSQLFFHLFQ